MFTIDRSENTALRTIAEAAYCPEYGPKAIQDLMDKLEVNAKGFAILMNVTPDTVRLWIKGAAKPSGTSKRLMQVYETWPSVVGRLADRQISRVCWDDCVFPSPDDDWPEGEMTLCGKS